MTTVSNDDPWLTVLAGKHSDQSAITVRKYADLRTNAEQQLIADMLHRRFTERYLDPALDNSGRHGFAVLAICCLMVEALESFRNGWKSSSGKSEEAFCSFFQAHDEFKDLRPVAHDFYRAVRCGILHQAETTDGWRVNQGQQLFFQSGGIRRISASEFGNRLKSVLDRYRQELVAADWNSDVWVKARRKIQAICRNCGLADADVASLA